MTEAAAEAEEGEDAGESTEDDGGEPPADSGVEAGAENDALSLEQLDEMFGEETEPDTIDSLTASNKRDLSNRDCILRDINTFLDQKVDDHTAFRTRIELHRFDSTDIDSPVSHAASHGEPGGIIRSRSAIVASRSISSCFM